MLAEFILKIKPLNNHPLPPSTAKVLNAFLLDVIQRSNRKLSRLLHNLNSLKPYTISRLIGNFSRNNQKLFIKKDEMYIIRMTSISDKVSKSIIDTLAYSYAKGEKILLWNNEFEILEFNAASISNYPPITECNVLYEISENFINSNNISNITMKFYSPTAFRAGNKNFLFPQPDKVFSSIKRKIKKVRPHENFTLENLDLDKIMVSKFKIYTSIVNIGKFSYQGFQGTVTFDITKLSKKEISELLFLALLANYCCVGMKTTMGMGQCNLSHPNPFGGNVNE